LLAQSAKGDEAAFASLYDQTAPRVCGLVLRILRDRAIAEEVTQEAYLQIWQTAARYDQAKGSALSWLMTVAHRRAVDRVRATEAHRRRDTAYHQESSTVEHDVTAAAAEASMEARRVRRALESLSPVQRHVLELAYFGGHTHTEIAAIVGIPVGTAKTRIRDGLIRLRGIMDDVA
jgi:RNA polymerase sigma-70 factor (ECF subfamily)